MREQYVEAVLAVAELIPPGHVLSYGDIAALLESGGPRQVGAVMSAHGSAVPWWRVIRASGAAPVCHEGRALAHYVQEQTALRGDTTAPAPSSGRAPSWRVDVRLARWNPGDAELDLLDAIAARLTHDDAPHHQVPAAAESMSVPRDGLGT
ncbi:MGMT family protein [Arthrobacter sp.]|uniref:MGMT family protein n=1 Tax=Arthrobacter sp. TaxID=1667 RepID=UPI0026DEE36D|nr:MGMT family protein [Arthrobacter sp.]MDO5751841.1 MGMT family protein [Arthrobacter sp.]